MADRKMTILTPLTEAGTPEEKENISVCSCGNPYVGTFIFPYAEWYCIECGSKHGLLGVSRVSVPKTDNLYRKWQKNVEKFEKAKKDYVPAGSKRHGCKKCEKRDEQHRLHLTKTQQKKHNFAEAKINSLILKKFH